ncbi:MAG: hypothetical protein CVU97_05325 [Firmicutes bacterium HGW-Firmicutes-21]|jgi:transcriptional regulator with XRE-family HTH domain|nr:MAG: hypothetical protein CVU97_05325 [Firmicutes bacterium HGW-Firmicutes-21]
MLKVGERIKKRREALNFQLIDLARMTGVTPSLISQIEKAKAFPSIFSLKKIADALQISVGSLIGEDETFSKNPVVKFDDKKFVQDNEDGTSLYLLSNHDQHKLMEPHLIFFPPKASSIGLINTNIGQSYYYVVKGDFTIEINSGHFGLQTGDSFYLNSAANNNIVNNSDSEGTLLWISANTANN